MDRVTEEALCDMQAQIQALRIAVRTIARTHPDPSALLAAWREALVETTTLSPAIPSDWRRSDYLADQFRAWAEDWTAELVELAVPFPRDRQQDSGPDGTAASGARPHSDPG